MESNKQIIYCLFYFLYVVVWEAQWQSTHLKCRRSQVCSPVWPCIFLLFVTVWWPVWLSQVVDWQLCAMLSPSEEFVWDFPLERRETNKKTGEKCNSLITCLCSAGGLELDPQSDPPFFSSCYMYNLVSLLLNSCDISKKCCIQII